uniref:Uncharacterized protein n=1 Tax=Aegilops tauschii subsp. strangulata TaxID=200361 RepID=A0A453MR30_AEGTS
MTRVVMFLEHWDWALVSFFINVQFSILKCAYFCTGSLKT